MDRHSLLQLWRDIIICLTQVWQSLLPLFCDKTFEFAIQTWQTFLEHYYVYVQTYFLSQLRKMLILLISSYCKMFTLGGFECCKSVTTLIYKVGNEFSWFGWPDWPRNVSALFFGRSGKVLYGTFSIVGMASQSHNVNKGIPDDRVARSRVRRIQAKTPYMRKRPSRKRPIFLTFHNSVFLLFFLLNLLFLSRSLFLSYSRS